MLNDAMKESVTSHSSKIVELPFDKIGIYYDLIYEDKDYVGEVDYVLDLIKRSGGTSDRILDLGCGTAKHAVAFAQRGCDVVGVDRSEAMLGLARERVRLADQTAKVQLRLGDVSQLRYNKTFDCVVSLFHIASYQVSDDSLFGYFQSASSAVKDGGLFLFDIWYGPAVVSTQPEIRVLRKQNSELELIRIAEPNHRSLESRVDIQYTAMIKAAGDSQFDCYGELHQMRYFGCRELKWLLNVHGFDLLHSESWVEGKTPSLETWSVTIVAKKR